MKPRKEKTLRQVLRPRAQDRGAQSKKPTVLIIEDERFLCRLLMKKFESSGFVVRVALDGETGLKIVEQELPDIILLDILLPGIDGFEILQRLKSNANSQGIPVVILSNLSEAREIDKAKNMGAAGYIVKAQSSPQQIVEKAREYIS